ncbi:hypothetical protein [Lysinibacillus sp. RC79]|uniref:hypothetical protein n=1 Tax=Lysinibacillus sp. RC79 TaxID=3156296 RepID=UPI003519A8F3
MNANLSYFSAGVQTPVPVATLSVQKTFVADALLSLQKTLLKEVKASGGCHRIGKEFFVQAQSRFRTQLRRGIIDCQAD